MGKHALRKISPKARLKIYDVAIAAGPLLVAYGLIAADKIGLWIAFVGALTGSAGNVIARANVDRPTNG